MKTGEGEGEREREREREGEKPTKNYCLICFKIFRRDHIFMLFFNQCYVEKKY